MDEKVERVERVERVGGRVRRWALDTGAQGTGHWALGQFGNISATIITIAESQNRRITFERAASSGFPSWRACPALGGGLGVGCFYRLRSLFSV